MKSACIARHNEACVFVADVSVKNGNKNDEFNYSFFACSPKNYKYCYKAGVYLKYEKERVKGSQIYYSDKIYSLFRAKRYLWIACNENMKEACDELKDLENLEEIIEDCKAKKQDACDKLKYLINL